MNKTKKRVAHLLGDLAARVLDLLLSRQEDQDVARRLARVDLHHRADGGLQVVALRLLRGRQRAVVVVVVGCADEWVRVA